MTRIAVSRQTLADQVFERIVEAIVVGDIATGAPVGENEIALRFVSVGARRVRRSCGLKARHGHSHPPHHGARVVDLSLDDLRSLIEIREALEGMACRLAVNACPMPSWMGWRQACAAMPTARHRLGPGVLPARRRSGFSCRDRAGEPQSALVPVLVRRPL